jgi:hypothetical protein
MQLARAVITTGPKPTLRYSFYALYKWPRWAMHPLDSDLNRGVFVTDVVASATLKQHNK